ncbi:hydroxymethylglutaryl-CoA reductase [Candidatus Daviesbacteria bacterium]|nr:hydroxymethylglutaryl-CoA reductase [Candidatus Daviesbacteria bacterium]
MNLIELPFMKSKISLRDFPSAKARREFLEKELEINLENIAKFTFTEEQVKGRNIENLIGATHIPLGIAGPLKILNTKYQILNTYIPLATTEGALVASISRGCKAISGASGACVEVETVGITRGPVFKTAGIAHGQKIKQWIQTHIPLISQITQKTSSHLKFLKADFAIVGRNLFVRFYFDSTDAMGMNMATIATQAIVKLIEQKTQAKCITLAGNFDIDKKPSWLNFISGRGKKVWAEVILPKKVVKEVLKTTPAKIVEVVNTKTHLGSIMSGSLGFNSHFANIIAAIFAATGQDLAHVVEGSLGVTTAEALENGELYFSIYLPDLIVGTVGGGTHLPTQQEALKIMAVSDVLEYCRAVGAAVLAGELSLIASLAEGTLAKAHQKLGRKK